MDDLIQWEPLDNQHLTARVDPAELKSGKVSDMAGRCQLCDNMVFRYAKYCDRCGAMLDWEER